MQELIKIESVPATLAINFDELRAHLSKELERYDVLVTEETLPGAKKLATELNQTAKTIDEKRKEAVAAVSEPIRKFDDQMKSLVTMCKEGRQKLLDQIQTFEDETRERARLLLAEYRDEMWEKHSVRPEFRKAEFADLVMLTAVTKGGNLASKHANDLESRVLADKSLQDRTGRRLLELENASFRAGLSAPLTRDHVAGFLMADDSEYSAELDRILQAEVRREEEAQRRMREKLEREQLEKAAREQAERDRIEREQRESEEKEQREKAEMAQASQAQYSRDDDPAFAEAITGDLLAQAEYHDAAQAAQDAVIYGQGFARVSAENVEHIAAAEVMAQPGKVRVTVWACFTPEVPATATDAQIEAALRKSMQAAGITTLKSIQIDPIRSTASKR